MTHECKKAKPIFRDYYAPFLFVNVLSPSCQIQCHYNNASTNIIYTTPRGNHACAVHLPALLMSPVLILELVFLFASKVNAVGKKHSNSLIAESRMRKWMSHIFTLFFCTGRNEICSMEICARVCWVNKIRITDWVGLYQCTSGMSRFQLFQFFRVLSKEKIAWLGWIIFDYSVQQSKESVVSRKNNLKPCLTTEDIMLSCLTSIHARKRIVDIWLFSLWIVRHRWGNRGFSPCKWPFLIF